MSTKNVIAATVDRLLRKEEQRIRSHSRQLTLDWVVIALGRMGWGEKRLGEFNTVVTEVMNEYADLFVGDYMDDKDMWYSKKKLDDELELYCGKYYAPYEERYADL